MSWGTMSQPWETKQLVAEKSAFGSPFQLNQLASLQHEPSPEVSGPISTHPSILLNLDDKLTSESLFKVGRVTQQKAG